MAPVGDTAYDTVLAELGTRAHACLQRAGMNSGMEAMCFYGGLTDGLMSGH
jgi:Na+-translocating ferredoxin:NAD+ oxidoreductase RnfC subunit